LLLDPDSIGAGGSNSIYVHIYQHYPRKIPTGMRYTKSEFLVTIYYSKGGGTDPILNIITSVNTLSGDLDSIGSVSVVSVEENNETVYYLYILQTSSGGDLGLMEYSDTYIETTFDNIINKPGALDNMFSVMKTPKTTINTYTTTSYINRMTMYYPVGSLYYTTGATNPINDRYGPFYRTNTTWNTISISSSSGSATYSGYVRSNANITDTNTDD
jgi:hypothetical protein